MSTCLELFGIYYNLWQNLCLPFFYYFEMKKE